MVGSVFKSKWVSDRKRLKYSTNSFIHVRKGLKQFNRVICRSESVSDTSGRASKSLGGISKTFGRVSNMSAKNHRKSLKYQEVSQTRWEVLQREREEAFEIRCKSS